jgi:hypothetical protein
MRGPTLATGIQISEVPTNLTIQRVYETCSKFPCFPLDLKPDFTDNSFTLRWIQQAPGSR